MTTGGKGKQIKKRQNANTVSTKKNTSNVKGGVKKKIHIIVLQNKIAEIHFGYLQEDLGHL